MRKIQSCYRGIHWLTWARIVRVERVVRVLTGT